MQIANSKATAKVAAVATALAMASSMLSFAPAVHAATTCDTGAASLTIGATGMYVTNLQNALIGAGYSIPAGATGYFGTQTQGAVAAWQAASGVAPAAGYFGPISRAAFNLSCDGSSTGSTGSTGSTVAGCMAGDLFSRTTGASCSAGAVVPGCVAGALFSSTTGASCASGAGGTSSGALEGGAGSVDSYTIISNINNEEVGEGADDVEVAGLEIEADESSDLELTAVRLVFDEGTAASDFEDYASEVSVWFDGKEVARVDADEFNDDNSWTKTISLARGAIVRSGDTGELVVAVSGNSVIDSLDIADTWDVDFRQVRFTDADGATISEDPSTSEVTFSFESFASAADVNLKVSSGDADINDAHPIAIDDNDDTDDVEVLSFKIKAEGNADLTVDTITVDFASVGAGVGEIINASALKIDGETYSASTTIASTTAGSMTVTYDDLDLTIDAGDTIEVLVLVDVNNLDGGFTSGDTLAADVNPDDSGWDVEDEQGDDLAAGDKSGTAVGDAHSFYADGLSITKGAADTAAVKDTTGDSAGGELGVYTINFEVTAFGDDLYIPTGATIATSTYTADAGLSYGVAGSDGTLDMLNAVGLASTTAGVTSSASKSGNYYVIREGETEQFVLEVTFTPLPAGDGYYQAALVGVNFNVGAAAAADTLQQALPSTDFATTLKYIDA